MNNSIRNFVILLTSVMFFSSCEEDILAPLDDNHLTLENIYDDPQFAEGLLMNAYTKLPTNNYTFSDVATDNAVSNNKDNGFLRMATGEWSAFNNPMNQWSNSFTAIVYLNKFLVENDKVDWSYTNADVKDLFISRHRGESYGLRALFMLNLLKAHAGYATNGELMGVPIITEDLEVDYDFATLQRNTFSECMAQIVSDLNSCEEYLPLDFKDATSISEIPSRYANVIIEDYNRVFGSFNNQRFSGRIAKAIRSQAALLAASPAFSDSNSFSWEDAAVNAGEVLNLVGGLSSLDPQGALFYKASNVDAIDLSSATDQSEMLWRGGLSLSNGIESSHYPPSLYGSGRVNPSQNLVDAFPMANGYPISDSSSGYQANSPYENRDPRLQNYIITNGSTFSGNVIYTVDATNDAIDAVTNSTRTGYYLKKLLREDVNLDPSLISTKNHYTARIRYTEIFLNYAEAANEAWGPMASSSVGFSAYEVIAAIRERAGINQPDVYLQSIQANKQVMRELIKNERRLELCFEGFRFWDLRRWKNDLAESVLGISPSNFPATQVIESRVYQDYMYYGPIPEQEIVKFGLLQNAGW